MGDDSLELTLLRAAIAQDPCNAASWLHYGNLLLKNNFAHKAAEAFKKALDLEPDSGDIRFCLGVALAEIGEHEEAAAHFRSLVGDDPGLEQPLSVARLSALMGVADCQGEMGRWKEAISTALPAVSMAIDILGHFAWFLQKAGYHDQAAFLFSVWLLLSPGNPDFLHAAGYKKMRSGRLRDALDDLGRALKLAPKSADLWYDFGVTLLRMGKREDGRSIMKKVLRLDPGFFWAYYDLACLEALEMKRDAAFKNLNRAVDCGFRDAAYLVNDTDFNAIRDDPRWVAVLERARGGAGEIPPCGKRTGKGKGPRKSTAAQTDSIN